jgi:pimeloyl-ACP methyl ester carboxylesterase
MKLNFRTYGSGQPLVILHGLFGTSDNWQTLGKGFADPAHMQGKALKVYLVDLRNHGHSPHSDEMNYGVMAQDIKELFEQENIQDAVLLGHSMGGKVAMYFAQEHAQLLDKLIVADMGAKAYPPHHQLIFEALMAVDLDKIKTRKEAEDIISEKIQEKSTVQFLMKNLYWSEREKLEWRMNLPVLYRDIDKIMVAVPDKVCQVKTLFIRGEKSNYVLDEDWEDLHRMFPNSRLETIVGSGHWVHAEKPKEFFELVKDFVV